MLFALTLGAVLRRPFGLHEAWWTCLGGGVALALRLVTFREALTTLDAGREALLFLLGLLLLSALLEKSGFFEWAALLASRGAGGSGRRLFRNVFLLGALVTAVLSLDTTAVLLTPVLLTALRRLRLPSRPYLVACALVANIGSLLLPISNLTNLLLSQTFHFSFAAFALRMLLPQVAALAVTFAVLRFAFRDELARDFDTEGLPAPGQAIRNPRFFRGACTLLGLVLLAYFVGPRLGVPPYVAALSAALLLAGWGAWVARLRLSWLREVSWGVFPFVGGLFVLVRAVENLGLAPVGSRALQSARLHHAGLWASAGGAAVASNLLNNLPAALLMRSVLVSAKASSAEIYGALLGTNIGPSATLFGSLATLLVFTTARARGEPVRARDFLTVGLVATPLALLAAAAALALTFRVWP